ncbi:MAG: CPBP family intramembrane metalloprotease [Planctomycetes bacterium]|nr:CPBP family intramembrane metalloprotease [Planctomycetota bacterium]
MSDEETRFGDDLPLEPILLPENAATPAENPYVSPIASSFALPRPPRVWTVFVLYILLIGGLVAVNVVLVLALAFWLHGPTFQSGQDFIEAVEAVTFSNVGLLSTVVCNACLLAGVTLLAAFLSPVPLRDRLRVRLVRLSPLAMLVSVVGTLAVSMVVTGLDGLGWLPESPMLEEFGRLVGEMSGLTLVAGVLAIGLGPGIGEELLFRGYIQTRLRRRWGPGWAIFCTSIMFGIMHFDLVQGSFAVVVGAFLGYLTERTGSILPAMVCHTLNNMLSTLDTAVGGLEIVGPQANALVLVGSIAVIALSVAYLRLYVKPRPTQPPETG